MDSMKQPKKMLNPGDVVYQLHNGRINERLKVVRASDTIAYLETDSPSDYFITVRREYSPRPGAALKEVLKRSWQTEKYYPETPELNAQYQHGELVHMVQVAAKSKADRLSTKQLKLILTILNDTIK